MSISDRIDQRLEALGISAREAARRAEVGESYIRDLRRNPQQSPRVEDLRSLAKALETNIEWLITGAGDPNMVPDEASAQVISIMPGLDAKRRAELASYAKFLPRGAGSRGSVRADSWPQVSTAAGGCPANPPYRFALSGGDRARFCSAIMACR